MTGSGEPETDGLPPKEGPSKRDVVWRVSPSLKALGWVFLAVSVWSGFTAYSIDDMPFAVSSWASGPVVLWLFFYRPKISISGECLVVVNPFRVRRFQLNDIVSVEPGYMGLGIKTNSGMKCEAWAVQQNNWESMLRHHGRAAQIAEEILGRSVRRI